MTTPPRHARPFRKGCNRAVRIPRERELEADEEIVDREGRRPVPDAVRRPFRLAEILAGLTPLDDEFPTVEDLPTEPEDIF